MKRLLPILALMTACGGDGRTPPNAAVAPDRDALMERNRRLQEKESRDIELWVRRRTNHFHTSGTGVRWSLVRDVPGDTARPEQLVQVNYVLTLLNGDTCYATVPGRPESFRVEHDEVESGLHEAIQHMSAGDSAIIVIPSHRAHGLTGDLNKVPMRSTVVYAIGMGKLTPAR